MKILILEYSNWSSKIFVFILILCSVNIFVAAQLAASEEGLSCMNE
jgi:hypothetical protein